MQIGQALISNDSWVVGKTDDGWTYPGKVTCLNDAFIIFEVYDLDGSSYETHREPSEIRAASPEDFDRFILDASKMSMRVEELIGMMYDAQKTVL